MTLLTREVDMKRMLDKKLPKFIISGIVITGMVLTSSPAFSREYQSSNGKNRTYEGTGSRDRDGSGNRDSNRGRDACSRDRYRDRDRNDNRHRCNDRNRCSTCRNKNARQTRYVYKSDALPAIIATGIIAGVAFSLLDNDPAPAPAVTAPATYPVGGGHAGITSSVVVTAALLNIRSGPGLGKPCVGQLYRGETLSIISTRTGWYYVQAPNGVNGWVMAQYTSPVGGRVSG
jgi:uncharacterized protein YgiM (DUF1202 family)